MIVPRVAQKHLKELQDKHPVSLKRTLLAIWHQHPREPGFSLNFDPRIPCCSLSPRRSWLGPEAGADSVVAEKAGIKLWLEAVTPEFDRLPSARSQGSRCHRGCDFLRAGKSVPSPCTFPSLTSELLGSTQGNTQRQTEDLLPSPSTKTVSA